LHTPVIFMPFDWWLAFEKLLRLNELLNGHKPGHEIPKCKKWAQEGTHMYTVHLRCSLPLVDPTGQPGIGNDGY
jgi:hypothetical protein